MELCQARGYKQNAYFVNTIPFGQVANSLVEGIWALALCHCHCELTLRAHLLTTAATTFSHASGVCSKCDQLPGKPAINSDNTLMKRMLIADVILVMLRTSREQLNSCCACKAVSHLNAA